MQIKKVLTVIAVGIALLSTGCAADKQAESTAPSQAGNKSQAVTPGVPTQCSYTKFGQPAKPVDPPNGKDVATQGNTKATFKLGEGSVVVTMDRAKTPCTTNNLESLIKQKFFDGTRCHRLVNQGIYVLQCGDPTGKGTGGPGYRFADELTSSETYPAGTLAMANSGPDTNGSQMFFVYKQSPLPPKYTVIGTFDQTGIGIIASIAEMGIREGTEYDPIAKATIESVTLG